MNYADSLPRVVPQPVDAGPPPDSACAVRAGRQLDQAVNPHREANATKHKRESRGVKLKPGREGASHNRDYPADPQQPRCKLLRPLSNAEDHGDSCRSIERGTRHAAILVR